MRHEPELPNTQTRLRGSESPRNVKTCQRVRNAPRTPVGDLTLLRTVRSGNLAGVEGFEPANAGIKIRCLNQLGDTPTRDSCF